MRFLPALALFSTSPSFLVAAPDGPALFGQYCAMCHQAGGQGVPNVFPPLAKSDFIQKSRVKSIQALCQGLNEKITVNGVTYNGNMPLVVLDDASVAAVLTHVFTSWGNAEPPVSENEVKLARAGTKYPTFAALQAAHSYAALPKAPEGWELREAGQLQFSPARMAQRPGDPRALLLSEDGNVWNFDPATGDSATVLAAANYADSKYGRAITYGFGWDKEDRLYITCNQRVESPIPNINKITIWRTEPIAKGEIKALPNPKPWFETTYPWGIGGFNHGISHIAQGPDGLMHVASGSRTDGGETGNDERYSREGETPITACIWKLDPAKSPPTLEVLARGMRNPFGFAWTTDHELYAAVNGPDADVPEELDHVVPGKHFGFPYQFAASDAKTYSYTPEAPSGLSFTKPVINQGPDGLDYNNKPPTSSFTPHSSPAGMIWLDNGIYPSSYRNSFILTRFGNLLSKEKDSGFDLLQVIPHREKDGPETATVKTLLSPLARPIDIVEFAPGRLLIAEYSRAITYAGGLGQPGRILELKLKR